MAILMPLALLALAGLVFGQDNSRDQPLDLKNVSSAAIAFASATTDHGELYAGAVLRHQQGVYDDAKFLVAVANRYRGEAGLAPLPYPPTVEAMQAAYRSSGAQPQPYVPGQTFGPDGQPIAPFQSSQTLPLYRKTTTIMPLPLIPLLGLLAVGVLAMGSGGKSGAPAGGSNLLPATNKFIAEHTDPRELYVASYTTLQSGYPEDAKALLGSCNYYRQQKGLPPMPWPPTQEGIASMVTPDNAPPGGLPQPGGNGFPAPPGGTPAGFPPVPGPGGVPAVPPIQPPAGSNLPPVMPIPPVQGVDWGKIMGGVFQPGGSLGPAPGGPPPPPPPPGGSPPTPGGTPAGQPPPFGGLPGLSTLPGPGGLRGGGPPPPPGGQPGSNPPSPPATPPSPGGWLPGVTPPPPPTPPDVPQPTFPGGLGGFLGGLGQQPAGGNGGTAAQQGQPAGGWIAPNGNAHYVLQDGDWGSSPIAKRYGKTDADANALVGSLNPGAPWGKMSTGTDLQVPTSWAQGKNGGKPLSPTAAPANATGKTYAADGVSPAQAKQGGSPAPSGGLPAGLPGGFQMPAGTFPFLSSMGPLLPLAGLAAAALLMMGGSKGRTAPAGAAPPTKDSTKEFIDSHTNPSDLYEAAKAAYAEGRTVDAAALLGAVNVQRQKTGLPPLPYPPVEVAKTPKKQTPPTAPTAPTAPAAPQPGKKAESPIAPPLVVLQPQGPGGRPPPPGWAPDGSPSPGGLPQSPLKKIGLPDFKGVAEEAVKSEIVKLVQNAAELGPLGSTIAVGSANIIAALIKGGDDALREALAAGIGAVDRRGCAIPPATPLAPLCGAVGYWIGSTMGTGLGLKKDVADVFGNRQARFEQLLAALVKQVPDDRGTRSGQESIYNRISAQLAVTCFLYVNRQNWGRVGDYGDTLDWGDGYIWNSFAGPATQLEQWNAACNKWGTMAFGYALEPLPEFKEGRCAAPSLTLLGCDGKATPRRIECRNARRKLWIFPVDFYPGGGAMMDGPGSEAWKNFEVCVSRILLVAKVETETRFARDVISLKNVLALRVMPMCVSIQPLEKAKATIGLVEAEARGIAYDTLCAARGMPSDGTPTEIAERGLLKLRNMAIAAGGKATLSRDRIVTIL